VIRDVVAYVAFSQGGIYGFSGEVIAKRLFHPRIFPSKMGVKNFKRGERWGT
jgi:hypothetical protein